MNAVAHPVRLEADLDPALSRWQWLVKWLLSLPLSSTWSSASTVGCSASRRTPALMTDRYPPFALDQGGREDSPPPEPIST